MVPLHNRFPKDGSKDNNQPLNPALGWSYANIQIIFDAIQRAGTLDKDKVNAALGQTDILTISNRVKYDEFQFVNSHFAGFSGSRRTKRMCGNGKPSFPIMTSFRLRPNPCSPYLTNRPKLRGLAQECKPSSMWIT